MAVRISYTGDPVLTLDEVAYQCRLDPDDLQPELIEGIIIPGVTAQCEAKTGAALREATYEEEWPESYGSGHALDVGQAKEVLSISQIQPDGSFVVLDVPHRLRHTQRESFLEFPAGRPSGRLVIQYRAGVDLEQHAGVKSWLLLQAGTAFRFRESLVTGSGLASLPESYIDTLLADITVPPRF